MAARITTVVLSLWLVVVVLLHGCSKSDDADLQTSPETEAPSNVLTADLRSKSRFPSPTAQSCGNCHEAQFQQWIESQHALANRLPSMELDGDAFEIRSELKHGSFVTETEFKHESYRFWMDGPDGASVHDAEAVIGIEPLRQYLVPLPGGRLQVVDVSWDTENKEWFNSFGDEDRQPHEWGFWKNRSMNWNSRCAVCHMTGFQKNYDPVSDSYASTWDEMGVSCLQCHVAKQAAVDSPHNMNECPVAEDSALVSKNRIEENCASCHARREELTGNFKPGDSFHDHYRLSLVDQPGTYYADGQVWDEDFEYGSFVMSRMHHKGVSCMDCHNPHSGQLIAPMENNLLCMSCHTAPGMREATPIDPISHSHHLDGSTGNACVNCHMPETTYMQVDPRRDHGFTIPDPLLTLELGIPNACNRCHTDEDAQWAAKWTQQWYGDRMERPSRTRARLIARAREGDRTVVEELMQLAQTEENSAWKAGMISLLAIWVNQEDVQQLLRESLDDEDPLVRSAAIKGLAPTQGARDLLRPFRNDDSRLVRIDAAWSTMNPDERDERSYQEVLRWLMFNSDQPTGAIRLGQFAMAEGKGDELEQYMRKVVAWDPAAYAYQMLGRALHANGKIGEAIEAMSRAVEMDGEAVDYRYALSLLVAEVGDLDRAIELLETSVEMEPRFGRAWYNLGLAYASREELDKSIEALIRAEQELPDVAEVPYARSTVHLRKGELAEAREASKKALYLSPDNEYLKSFQLQLDAMPDGQ